MTKARYRTARASQTAVWRAMCLVVAAVRTDLSTGAIKEPTMQQLAGARPSYAGAAGERYLRWRAADSVSNFSPTSGISWVPALGVSRDLVSEHDLVMEDARRQDAKKEGGYGSKLSSGRVRRSEAAKEHEQAELRLPVIEAETNRQEWQGGDSTVVEVEGFYDAESIVLPVGSEVAVGRADGPLLRGGIRPGMQLGTEGAGAGSGIVDVETGQRRRNSASVVAFEQEDINAVSPEGGAKWVQLVWPRKTLPTAGIATTARRKGETRKRPERRLQHDTQQATDTNSDAAVDDSFGAVGLLAFFVCFGLLFCIMEVAKCYCLLEYRRRQRIQRQREGNIRVSLPSEGVLPIASSRPAMPAVPAASSKEDLVEVIVDGVLISLDAINLPEMPSVLGYPVLQGSHAMQEAAEDAQRVSPRNAVHGRLAPRPSVHVPPANLEISHP